MYVIFIYMCVCTLSLERKCIRVEMQVCTYAIYRFEFVPMASSSCTKLTSIT